MNTEGLVYGELYALWRDGIYLGRAYWTKDEIHGNCFLVEVEHEGQKMKQVFIADSWVKAKLG
jgi:hypothetical protein